MTETTFEDEAGPRTTWRQRAALVLTVPVLALGIGTGTAVATPVVADAPPAVTQVGKWDDLTPFQIEQLFLMGQFFKDFGRFGNGDGGGQGEEEGEAVAGPCPVCGQGYYGNSDSETERLGIHLFLLHYDEWLKTQQK